MEGKILCSLLCSFFFLVVSFIHCWRAYKRLGLRPCALRAFELLVLTSAARSTWARVRCTLYLSAIYVLVQLCLVPAVFCWLIVKRWSSSPPEHVFPPNERIAMFIRFHFFRFRRLNIYTCWCIFFIVHNSFACSQHFLRLWGRLGTG